MYDLIYKYLENLFLSTNLYIKESKIINDLFLKCMDNKYSFKNEATILTVYTVYCVNKSYTFGAEET